MIEKERVVATPEVLHGKPRIRGIRIAVEQVLDLLAAGKTTEEVVSEYFPDLTVEDVLACLQFARAVVSFQEIAYG